ncbi:hypothetical protein RP20_CCG020716 [Aedes albopictus]|nr:hypothetical protein RP20_CCG020716 [Aedes albopictus]
MENLSQKCLAPNCSSTTDQPEISFFDFPSKGNRDLIRSWNKALGFRANCKHIPDPKVCERHFQPEELDRNVIPVAFARPGIVPSWVDSESAEEEGEQGSNYCRLCAKVERQPMENSLEKLMQCSETAKLLEICLQSSLGYDMLPSEVCNTCACMMKSWIKFVKTCSAAQYKLIKLLGVVKDDAEEETTMSETEASVTTTIKRELRESNELPANGLLIGLEVDVKSQEARYDILEETEFENEASATVEKHDNEHLDVNVKMEPCDTNDDSDCDTTNDYVADAESNFEMDEDDDDEYVPEGKYKGKLGDNKAMKHEINEGNQVEENPKRKRGRPRKHEPRPPREPRKPKEKRDKSDKPASLCKQVCQVCGKILSNSASFSVHMLMHTQQKDVVCPICGKRFYIKQQLKVHIESIHEKKDFVCNVCGLKCRWQKSLRRHMLLHDDNPYKHKCTYCDKAFSRPNQLRHHVMKHTGDRVYCDICGADYRFNYMLTQHKIRKHGIVIEGVQLYKQSARRKKSEGGNQLTSAIRNRVVQQVEAQLQPLVHSSITIEPMAFSEHDRVEHSDQTHVSDLGSPVATDPSFETIGSPDDTTSNIQGDNHLRESNGTTQLNMATSSGLMDFHSIGRQ